MNKTYNIVLEAICAALITVCSWISLQIMDIPFTLQTFGIFLVLFTIGGKRGIKSGPAALIGPTGGFIIGFIFVGLCYWLLDELCFKKLKKSSARRLAFCIIEGVILEVVLYVFGVIWFMVVYTRNTGDIGLAAVLSMCVYPFLIPDLVKLIAAASASLRTHSIVKQQ